MKFQPLEGRIIVKVDSKEDIKTAGGIIIPKTGGKVEEAVIGEVVATGGEKYIGEKRVPMVVKTGDKVMFNLYKAGSCSYEGVEYFSLPEENVFAIIK